MARFTNVAVPATTRGAREMARIPMTMALTAASVLRFVEAQGQPIDGLLAGVGLQRSRVADAKARIPFSQQVALLEAAAALFGDDCFGIRCGATFDPSRGGLYLYILVNSPNLGASVDNIRRYMYIHNEGTTVERQDEGDQVRLCYDILDPAASASVQQIGLAFSSFLCFARARTGLRLMPDDVQVVHPPHTNPCRARQLLGAPIHYGMSRNVIAFPASWMSLPLSGADVQLLSVLTEYADLVLAERRRHVDLVDQVQDWIIKQLPTGRLDAEAAARAFGMSARTLARRLAVNKTSFSQLVEDMRGQLARHYVADPSLSLTSIAFLLGYADPSSFSKAFKNRFGVPPQRYRAERGRVAA